MVVILALMKLRQEEFQFEVSLAYTMNLRPVRPYFKIDKNVCMCVLPLKIKMQIKSSLCSHFSEKKFRNQCPFYIIFLNTSEIVNSSRVCVEKLQNLKSGFISLNLSSSFYKLSSDGQGQHLSLSLKWK